MAGNLREEGLYIQTGNPFSVNEVSPQFAPGQLGKVSAFSNAGNENGVSGEVGILVQNVQRYATDTVAVIQGGLAFWQDMDNFVVTGEPANAIGGTTEPIPAGIWGGTLPAAGNIGFIQVAGVAPGRFADSTSVATVGKNLIWATNHQLKQAGTQDSDSPVVAVLKTLNTATTTNISAEVLLNLPVHTW